MKATQRKNEALNTPGNLGTGGRENLASHVLRPYFWARNDDAMLMRTP